MKFSYIAPQRVDISKSRWTAWVTITDAEGAEHKYVASADSGITYGDGLYLGDSEDYAEACAEAGY